MDEVINDPTAAEDDRNADQDRYEQGHDFLLRLLKSKRYVNADPRIWFLPLFDATPAEPHATHKA